jgi:hypothetical protein
LELSKEDLEPSVEEEIKVKKRRVVGGEIKNIGLAKGGSVKRESKLEYTNMNSLLCHPKINLDDSVYNQLSDQQLDVIGKSRNIPIVSSLPRELKLQAIYQDENRLLYEKEADELYETNLLNTEMEVQPDEGELLYIAAKQGIPVHLIYTNPKILLVLLYLSKLYPELTLPMQAIEVEPKELDCDYQLVLNLLSDDELLQVISVFNQGQNNDYFFTLKRNEILDTLINGFIVEPNLDILQRNKKFEALSILPKHLLQSISFSLQPSQLHLSHEEKEIIRLLILTQPKSAETIFNKYKVIDPSTLGIVVPPTFLVEDYIGINYAYYPTTPSPYPPSYDKLKQLNLEERLNYLSTFSDQQIISSLKVLPAFTSRKELVHQMALLFEPDLSQFFMATNPKFKNTIIYGNNEKIQKLSLGELTTWIQDQWMEVKDNESKKCSFHLDVRQIEKLLMNQGLLSSHSDLNKVLTEAIMYCEGRKKGGSDLYDFHKLAPKQVATLRHKLLLIYFYSFTKNQLYDEIKVDEDLKYKDIYYSLLYFANVPCTQ